MDEKLKALHLIFNDSPIYAIDENGGIKNELINGEQKIGFISKYQSKNEIPESELTFLQKIFSAAKLNENEIEFSNTIENKSFSQVIGMGVNPFELGIQDATFPYYEVKSHNTTTYLFADDIPTIMNNTDKKGGLWNGLKRMFGV